MSISQIAMFRQLIWAYSFSPWISRLLSELGHEVIVANARKVRLIGESRKKDDRLDAQTWARLARIDPELLYAVKHLRRRRRIG
jgi:transposase